MINEHDKRVLSDFPHVEEKLVLFWGYPEFLDLIRELTQSNRTEIRQGFPRSVFEDIIFLRDLYLNQLPLVTRESISEIIEMEIDKKTNNHDVWSIYSKL